MDFSSGPLVTEDAQEAHCSVDLDIPAKSEHAEGLTTLSLPNPETGLESNQNIDQLVAKQRKENRNQGVRVATFPYRSLHSHHHMDQHRRYAFQKV